MKEWSLLLSPDGTYSLWVKEEESYCFNISNEDAELIISKIGCKVEEMPL